MMRRRRYSPDLRALIAECDANYARLMRLLPGLDVEDERTIDLSLPGGACRRLVFRVVERCPYTTTVRVIFAPVGERRGDGHSDARDASAGDAWHPMLPAPSFTVRLYHDARTAEATEYQRGRRLRPCYDYPNAEMRLPDEKSQANRFLGEYLAHCLEHGIAVEPVVGPREGSLS